jgi:hypothetical protein
MERTPFATLCETGPRGRYLTFPEQKSGDSSVDFLLGARVDSAWILGKFGIPFSDRVMEKLKKAVYAIGQGSRRWVSCSGELSGRQVSAILDYLVLVELLLTCRNDLRAYREDLRDCREQLVMQVNRYTEGQPDRVASLVKVLVNRFREQLNGAK